MGEARSYGIAQGGTDLILPDAASRPRPSERFHRPLDLKNFFGRRRGKTLSRRQQSSLYHALADARIDIEAPAPASNGLAGLFAGDVTEVWLEIGFGAGEHLLWQLENNPHVGIIGAEPFVNGVASTLAAAQENNLLSRIRLHADDATPLLDWLPEASIARAFMLFPDPWPKKRHRGRRLFSANFADRLTRILKDGAELRFASDIADYSRAALAIAESHPNFVVTHAVTSADRGAILDWPETRYERKALAQGRASTFLSQKRVCR